MIVKCVCNSSIWKYVSDNKKECVKCGRKLEIKIDNETWKKILEEAKPHLDEFVLDGFEVVKFRKEYGGVIDDGWDYCWHFEKSGVNGYTYYSSCCFGWTALKGVLPDDEYNEIGRIWNLNEGHWKSAKESRKIKEREKKLKRILKK